MNHVITLILWTTTNLNQVQIFWWLFALCGWLINVKIGNQHTISVKNISKLSYIIYDILRLNINYIYVDIVWRKNEKYRASKFKTTSKLWTVNQILYYFSLYILRALNKSFHCLLIGYDITWIAIKMQIIGIRSTTKNSHLQ